ncbi:MAG: DUF411 domain-containing protein [Oricola sp.]|nr:DUF411 domain-containing protein [Oricola sp.]
MRKSATTRHLAALIVATGIVTQPLPAIAGPADQIHVIKGIGCGCCTAWVEYLRGEGFVVTEEEMLPADLIQHKIAQGIPAGLVSCHTAHIGDFVVEGHVPATDIHRLLNDKPDVIGISVSGMPYGSPGMGPEAEREAYDVFVIRNDGSTEIYSAYPAGS